MSLTPEQEERRGEEARQWLENPIYRETWGKIEAAIVTKMKASGTTDEQVLEWNRYLRLMEKVQKEIAQVATTGTMAAMEQERQRTMRDRVAEGYRRLVA